MFFATDIANFLACKHIATLNREQAEGKISKKIFGDPGTELLRKLGLEHELKYLNELKGRGLKVVEIPTDVSWSEAAAATRVAMVQGADVIYQATFIQEPWAGRADFLLRVETPSEIGAWSYEVVETKLAKSTKARALIQLCFYSELVAAIQGGGNFGFRIGISNLRTRRISDCGFRISELKARRISNFGLGISNLRISDRE
jgi:predicted RecB family nuclease